jgi:mRNA interferase RelE/StbE
MYEIRFKKSVSKDLKNIGKSKIRLILKEIEKLKNSIENNEKVIKLQGNNPYFRLRVQDYRIIFEKQDDKLIILVIKIGHRKDIYKRI